MSAIEKKDIRKLNVEQLQQFFVEHGDKAFRGKQVYEWLWKKSLRNFDEMTNISLETRELLKKFFEIKPTEIDQMQRSVDGTIKNAVKLHDGLVVESVLIPTEKRITACVSSQVGCSLDCKFCATAKLKRMRNLNADEIYDQVVLISEQGKEYFQRPLTNIVLMGMGEPLLNYANVMSAMDKITSPEGLGMSPKRITLSTVGVSKMIRKLADDDVKFNLAVSLHSAIDEKRSSIMSINDASPLDELMDSLQYWYDRRKSRITFEYVVWKDFNDSDEDIRALVKYCKRVPSKVNLIQYNPIGEELFEQADAERVAAYERTLEANGIVAKVRRSRGQDIDAACGQLANKN